MHEFAVLKFDNFEIDISALLAIIVTCLIVFILARLAVRNLSIDNPSKLQNFMEWVVEFVHNLVAGTMPLKKAAAFVSLAFTLIFFIFVANLLGLPFVIGTEHTQELEVMGAVIVSEADLLAHDGHVHLSWWKSPTADLSVTFGLATIMFLLIHFLGVKMNRKHYFQHYFKPFPIFFPLNLLETIVKPLTLGVRLFANIFAGEVLISTILMLSWFGIPLLAVWQGFSIFVGAIQAFLFTILSMVYISQAIVHEEAEH